MRDAGLPPDYRVALASGIWPSCHVLPARETREQGVPLSPGSINWKPSASGSKVKVQTRKTRLLWPELLGGNKGGAVQGSDATHDLPTS
jgi:hypothetical protein